MAGLTKQKSPVIAGSSWRAREVRRGAVGERGLQTALAGSEGWENKGTEPMASRNASSSSDSSYFWFYCLVLCVFF